MIIWVITIAYAVMIGVTLVFEYGHSEKKQS